MVDSVEKLLFRSYCKNSRPVEASLFLGRGGPCDLRVRMTPRLLANVPTILRANRLLQRTHARIKTHCNFEFCNRIGRKRSIPLLNSACERIQIVRPMLHHLPPFHHVLGPVISRSYFVTLDMRKLSLDDIRSETLFVQDR